MILLFIFYGEKDEIILVCFIVYIVNEMCLD